MRLIDADQLIQTLNDRGVTYNADANDAIINAPTIDAKPAVYAHWIEDDYGYSRCSECGWEWYQRETITPYCPNCGAKMDEEDTDEVD